MPLPLVGILLLAVQDPPPPHPMEALTLALAPPVAVVSIDTGKVKGDPHRLAWSPDGRELYLQVVERDRSGRAARVHHHLVGLADRRLHRIETEPPWAAAYWAWKSGQAAPGAPAFRITVDIREELVRATATPMGGNLARGDPTPTGGGAGAGAGVGIDEAASAAYQSQKVTTYTLRLKGELLGEWKNTAVVPGLTFGWAPAALGVIAFVTPKGDLVVMDAEGRKQAVPGVKDGLLPAWSEDGRRLAWLAKAGKKRLVLQLVDVGLP